MKRLAALLCAALAAPGCFSTQGINRFQPNLYSVDQEIGLGRELSKEIEQEVTLVRHHGLEQVVQTIGERFRLSARTPEWQLYPFTLKVVDSPEINAFSLPGGPVYVNMGLVELVESEDELATVLAHEMSHVVARHATERVTTLQLSQIALLAALTAVGGAPALALEGTRLGYILGILRYSRSAESEADAMAFELLRDAGYDAAAMITVLERIEAERRAEPILLERLLSSHPLPDDRIAAVRAMIGRSGLSPPARTEALAFARVKLLFAKD